MSSSTGNEAPGKADVGLEGLEKLHDLPSQDGHIKEGSYVVKSEGEETWLMAETADISTKIWFKTSSLKIDTIRQIKYLQLVAESHDQGFADDESAGNWTWLELAIFEDENAESPRIKDGAELVWESHENRFLKDDYGWTKGARFNENDDILRLLEDGNCIGVQLGARFPGWQIFARGGYLEINFKARAIKREALNIGKDVPNVLNIVNALDEANISADFKPKLVDGIFRADNLVNANKRPLRVLSLDGGGVRGLSTLRLLQAVMDKANITDPPYKIFDMIGGTSTGGLIAIMLGLLKMDIKTCIEKYEDFMGQIFVGGSVKTGFRLVKKGAYYDAAPLEKLIKNLIQERLGRDPEEVKLNEGGETANTCKVFVLSVRKDAANNHEPVFLRSYQNSRSPQATTFSNIKMWEAARATSAAPAYFAPLKVNDYELIDGGVGANNPLGWLWMEVLGVFGPDRKTDCFLSIGTGIGKNEAIGEFGGKNTLSSLKALAGAATNTQIIHVLFRTLIDAYAPQAGPRKYWRLNVGEAIPARTEFIKGGLLRRDEYKKHLDDYEELGDLADISSLPKLKRMTESYIEAQSLEIEGCGRALK